MINIKVTKRNGKKEPVMLDKVLERINQQTYGLDLKWVQPFEVAQKVIEGITPDIQTRILDQLAMETAAALTTKHPDYATLAARLAITALHKETNKSFSETVTDLYNYVDPNTRKHSPVVSLKFFDLVKKHADQLNSAIVHSRDHNFDYFGYKVLERSYLLKLNGQVAERPQYMYMRTALQIWGENIEKALETYNLLSESYYTHATPTLFNSGTNRPQLSSCFLLDVESDSIEGIFNTLKEAAQISKNAGGIGISFNKVRAKNTYIAGTNGSSNGIIPFLKIYNETARAVDQCFTKDSKVITKNGTINIDVINEGDEVLTSDGTFNKVTKKKTFNKKSEDIIVIKTESGINKVTGEHQILVIRNLSSDISRENIIKGIKNGVYQIEWIAAKELLKGDKILKY
jgi:ribonucleoside-diphosphate reductase alpha chain